MAQSPTPDSASPMLEFERRTTGGAVVLTVRGDIDMLTAPDLTEAILEAGRVGLGLIVVDLTEVEFLGSAGMTALVLSQRALAPAARQVVVADGPGTSRPLKLMGLAEELGLYASLDEALASTS